MAEQDAEKLQSDCGLDRRILLAVSTFAELAAESDALTVAMALTRWSVAEAGIT